jgi:hypothetical protein
MQNRTLAGVNARFKFWENMEIDLYIASGALYEHELWNPELSYFDFDSSVTSVTRVALPTLKSLGAWPTASINLF